MVHVACASYEAVGEDGYDYLFVDLDGAEVDDV